MHPILRPLTSCRARRLRQLGGALLAMVATLLVAASATLAIRMAAQVGDRTERFVQTQSQMQRIRLALHAFAASHGRLPCPANGALDTGAAAPNAATTLCTSRDGTVPWATMGLSPDDALDAWGRKISYRVYDGAAGMTPLWSPDSFSPQWKPDCLRNPDTCSLRIVFCGLPPAILKL